ncbi:MAG: NAD(P)H-dependent oxidoreductase subunit E [Tepidisphaeraceae bacterium]
MAWIAEDRRSALEKQGQPLLTEALKQTLREKYFPRYPTKRAVLLPGLHLLQHEYNWLPMQAVQELAEFLEIQPAEALDTASFYEEYWLKPKGKYLFQVCRSLACEICESSKLTAHLQQKLGIEPGETSDDGKYTLVELECLGACGTAPVMGINDALFENVTIETIDQLIAKLPEDPHDFKDPTVTWDESHGH